MPKLAPPPALLAAALSAGLPVPPATAAERPWFEMKTPGFTIVSADAEGRARDIAWQFEQVRSALPALWPWLKRDDERGFVVFVARDEKSLAGLAPGWFRRRANDRSVAVYVSSIDADYVALRTDLPPRSDPRVNQYLTAFRGYADNVLVRQFPGRMPQWLREGWSEILANTIVRDNDVEFGRAIPWHIEDLTGRATESVDGQRAEDRRTRAPGTSALLPLARLVAVTRDDPEYTGEASRRMFDAQSWAFVHFLMFGDGGAHRPRFNRMAALLRDGTPADKALAEAIGDVSELEKPFRAHVALRALPFQRAPVDVGVAKEKWPARPLAPAEEAAARALFAVAMGEKDLARERIAAARAADPALPASYEAEGLLLARDGDTAGARAALLKAREMGSKSAWLAARLDGAPRRSASPAAAPANVDRLVAACGKGDEEACRRMAEILTIACEGGDAPSCMPLGFLYVRGRGVEKDVTQGEMLFERACDAGEGRACAALARSILDRSQAPADRTRAEELMAKACAAGVAAACGEAKR
jgi:hypothetical protein